MTAQRVKSYYERNTRSFLRFGQGASTGTIHRAVWGPGIRDRTAGFGYVHRRIAERIPKRADGSARVLDLGCGVGASLIDLATQRDFEGIGVTVSPTQVELARGRIAEAGLTSRLRCVEADFTALPVDLRPVDLAYGIESFVHGPDPNAFFAEAARVVRPGGTLVVCDDFLTARGAGADLSARDRRWLDEFRRGWSIQSLLTADLADEIGRVHGFERTANEDWTPWLELQRPRDRLIEVAVTLGRRLPIRHPWWGNLLGGNALQRGLLSGLLSYRFVVWSRGEAQAALGSD